MASYNGEKYISAQIDSIIAQLQDDDEIIVSDDGSSDTTIQIVKAKNDSRIKIFSHASRVGYIKNFERAVGLSKGHILFFSDQDDVWLPNKVSRTCAALMTKGCVVSDAVVVDKNLRILHSSFFQLRKASKFSFLRILLKPCFVGATMACTREYLNRLMPFPNDVPHDFWITINALKDRNLEIIFEPTILYRRHADSASVSASAAKRHLLVIFKERFRLIHALAGRKR